MKRRKERTRIMERKKIVKSPQNGSVGDTLEDLVLKLPIFFTPCFYKEGASKLFSI